jgi:large repetitive protein
VLSLDSLTFVSANAGSAEGLLAINEIATYRALYTLVTADLAAGGLENTVTATGISDQDVSVSDVSDDGDDADGNTTDDPTVLVLAPAPTLAAEKSASVDRAQLGDIVTYTIGLSNPLDAVASNLTFVDILPDGVSYVAGSAAIDGTATAPVIAGPRLTWPGQTLAAGGQATITLQVRITATAGDVVNTAQIENAAGQRLSNVATASVRIAEEAVFVCTDIIGKVFDDRNYNGYQDGPEAAGQAAREPGLPGVRLATVDGTIITTDEFGRYSVPCAAIPRDTGSNFTLKVDPRSLPTGYRLTTENPRTLRVTQGMLTEMNFGATVGNVIDIDLTAAAFVRGSVEPVDRLDNGLMALLDQVKDTPSVIHLSYLRQGEAETDIRARMDRVEQLIRDRWRVIGRYRLVIERTIEQVQ